VLSYRFDMPTHPKPDTHVKNPAAQALGRLGGAKNSPKQVKARLKNAKLAGRPGRVCADCGLPVYGGHKDAKQNARCTSQRWEWRQHSHKP